MTPFTHYSFAHLSEQQEIPHKNSGSSSSHQQTAEKSEEINLLRYQKLKMTPATPKGLKQKLSLSKDLPCLMAIRMSPALHPSCVPVSIDVS